jgi:quinol monooxygenase YgiN
LIERWTSREALDRHLTADHLQAFRAAAPAVMGGPAEILVMEALPEGDAGKGRL